MKTKIGKLLLAHHSEKIAELTNRFNKIAIELKRLTEVDSQWLELIEEAGKNREELSKHQDAINLICCLEATLDQGKIR